MPKGGQAKKASLTVRNLGGKRPPASKTQKAPASQPPVTARLAAPEPKRKSRAFSVGKKPKTSANNLLKEEKRQKAPPPAKKAEPKKIQDPESLEREKQLIMRAGVTFFMLLIIVVWLYNAKSVFRSALPEAEPEAGISLIDWQDLSGELGERMAQIKDDLESLETASSSLPIEDASSGQPAEAASTSPILYGSLPLSAGTSSTAATGTGEFFRHEPAVEKLINKLEAEHENNN